MVLIWYPLSEFEVTLQHEVFGHGYRIRDIGSNIVKVQGYEFDPPFPYGDGGELLIMKLSKILHLLAKLLLAQVE